MVPELIIDLSLSLHLKILRRPAGPNYFSGYNFLSKSCISLVEENVEIIDHQAKLYTVYTD